MPTYCGIRVFSRGVGYVMDTSASMSYEIEVDPEWVKKNRRDYPARATKFDLARGEIEASLAALDPRTRINLYFMRTAPLAWKPSVVSASPKNVEAAVSRLAGERPRDSFGQQAYRTNYVDTFRLVLQEDAGKPPAPGFSDTPDTVLFLTDGKPTVGDITEPDVLLSWLAEKNRFAWIHFHVITFGSLETDDRFLRRLAEENGGKFVRVPSP